MTTISERSRIDARIGAHEVAGITQDQRLTFERRIEAMEERMGAVEERVKALEATPRVKEVMTAAGLASPATPAKPAPSMRSAASLKSAASLLPRECDFILYKERNLIERLFGKLKQFRAIATRYDKLARNFLGAIRLVAAVIQLNRGQALSRMAAFSRCAKSNNAFPSPTGSPPCIVDPRDPDQVTHSLADIFFGS